MKYTQYSQRKKGNTAFYIVIGLCLVLIGVAAWVAFSRISNSDQTNPSSQNSIKNNTQSNISEYDSKVESYNDNVPSTPSEIVESDSANDNTSSNASAQTQETTKVRAFAMPVGGEILKDFSIDTLQFSSTYNDMRIHNGVDITCTEDTLVGACTDGKVESVEQTSNFGGTVTIDHGDGLMIKYCGLQKITVEKGNKISMGDSIGSVGIVPSECADQSHLHIEAYQNGESISLLKFFE